MTPLTAPTATRPVPVPDPVHDGRHRLADGPLERESMPYIVSLPEHGLGMAIYTWVDRDGVAGALFAAFGPAIGDEPVVEVADGVDVGRVGPDGAAGAHVDFDDWRVGPVHVAHALDLHTARVRGLGERVQLDVTFTATHPAYAYSAHPAGCPPYAATDRLEQSGRVRGTVTVDGTEIAVDTTAARDHSWGTRDWDHPQHWKWVHAQAGDVALHFWQIQAGGHTELRGYVVRPSGLVEVARVDVDFVPGPSYRQRALRATVVDVDGGHLELAGEHFGHFSLSPVPTCTLVEGAMAAEIDGVPGVGWSEFMWPTAYLERLAARP